MVNKEKFKETELGLIPKDWKIGTLGEVSSFINDGTHHTPRYVDQGIDFYSVENVTANDFINTKKISLQEHKKLVQRCKPERGDLLLTRIGTLGRTKLIDWEVDASIYVSLALIKLKEEINSNYVYSYTKSRLFVNEIFRKSLTNAVPQKINMNEINAVKIILPDTPREQQAIASVLSDMDGLIESLGNVVEKKKKIKQGTMQQLLTGKKRLPGFTGEWEDERVDDFGFTTRGRVISRKEINKAIISSYPVYSSQTTNNGVMGYIDTYDFEGDHITWTTDGANAGRVFYRKGKFNCTNVCGVIKLKRHDYEYISLALNEITRNYVSTNLANPKLMNDVMRKVMIKVPSNLKEQQAISSILSDMDTEIELLEEKLAKYEKVKEGMMQQLLTGRIRLV